jgi:hypothetical protein
MIPATKLLGAWQNDGPWRRCFLVAAGFAAALCGVASPAGAASSGGGLQSALTGTPAPGDQVARLLARARFVSAYDALQRAGTPAGAFAPAAAAPASPRGPLGILAFKRGLSKFAGAGSGAAVFGAPNVGIGISPAADENEPTVAASPAGKGVVVAGSHSFDVATGTLRCVAYRSRDGGRSWSAPVALPQLSPDSFCSDPVLAYAADGRRVYYAYMDIKVSDSGQPPLITFSSELDVLVSHSDDGGATWSRPAVALDGDRSVSRFNVETGEVAILDAGFDFDKPWIATAAPGGRRTAAGDRVYVSGTRFDNGAPAFDCRIVVATSPNRNGSWGAPVQLDSSSGGFCGDPVLVQGSRPSAGPAGDALVAWYHSGSDGPFQGSFEIRTATSPSGHGWNGPVTAVRDSFEVPFFLGPYAFYHRWGASLFPDVEIAADGVAHIAYTHDPQANGVTVVDPETGESFFLPDVSTTSEDGDIRYVRSSRAPYRAGSWSAPVTLNDDRLARAQGFPALETAPAGNNDGEHKVDGQGEIVRVIWEDHRRSPSVPEPTSFTDRFPVSSNLYYDIYATTLDARGRRSRNERVTSRSSISDYIFIGDYNDLTASGDQRMFGIWTDRRHQKSTGASLDSAGNIVIDEAAFEDNVFGAPFGGIRDE